MIKKLPNLYTLPHTSSEGEEMKEKSGRRTKPDKGSVRRGVVFCIEVKEEKDGAEKMWNRDSDWE